MKFKLNFPSLRITRRSRVFNFSLIFLKIIKNPFLSSGCKGRHILIIYHLHIIWQCLCICIKWTIFFLCGSICASSYKTSSTYSLFIMHLMYDIHRSDKKLFWKRRSIHLCYHKLLKVKIEINLMPFIIIKICKKYIQLLLSS